MTYALKLVTCHRCGKKTAAILMHKSITTKGLWYYRNFQACKRRARWNTASSPRR